MNYHNITKDDMLNGDGLRVVLWVSGCSHHCKNCHNPITWDPNDGLPFDEEAKTELFAELAQPYISGITLSGGDPLFCGNRAAIGELIKEIKARFPDKTIWLYTGYTWEAISDLLFLPYIDVLVDGKFVENLKDTKLHWRGSSNQRIIDVKASLEQDRVVLHEEDQPSKEMPRSKTILYTPKEVFIHEH
jgi:anaerobic ribonucleoside-triphosphate reductase activating protein